MSHYSLSALASDLVNGLVSGFTVNVVMMEPVVTGFSVGGHPECAEVRLAGLAELPPGLVAMHLRHYAEVAHLYGEGKMGGWTYEGDLYLDAPTIYFDGDEAEQAARDRGELAYFDLSTLTEHLIS